MVENKYLNEQKYKKTEKAITLVAILVLVVGLCIGGFLIYRGVAKPGTAKVEKLKGQLEAKKQKLEAKGVKYDASAEYFDGEEYDLKIITKALDPSFDYCEFDEYKNNSITKEYCSAKNSIGDFASIGSIMLGVFICMATCMTAGFIFFIAKGRSIHAFATQQHMPVAKESINEMAPTIGKAAGTVAKSIKESLESNKKDE